MAEPLREHLEFLYGPQPASGLVESIQALIEAYRSRIPSQFAGPGRSRLTQCDALLITYADQVREPSVSPLRTLAEFLEEHARGIVSGVHLLPFYPASSDDGFAVMDYREVDPAFGDWQDIGRLGQSFDLMFDAVFNHMSAQSGWFRKFLDDEPAFRDFFVTVDGSPDLSSVVRPRTLPLLTEFQSARGQLKVWTTFSADQVDLNLRNPSVLLALIDVLLFYVTQGARFVRLDAIAFLWKEIGTSCLHLPQTHRIIQLLRLVLDLAAPKSMLITETNVPHADNVAYFGNGLNEAQLVYNFALPPLVLHSLATGNASKLTAWAKSLSAPSEEGAFFNFLASHDGIGLNPARGILDSQEIEALVQRSQAHGGFISYKTLPDGSSAPYEMNINFFDALSNPANSDPLDTQIARAICAHAVMFALPGVPGIYFHSLFGSRGDRAGAESSGIPRRINREKLTRQALESDLANPHSLRALVLTGLRQLLAVRREQGAFAPAGEFHVLDLDPRVFAVLRKGLPTGANGQAPVLCIQNVSDQRVELPLRNVDALRECSPMWRHLAGCAPLASDGAVLPPFGVCWAIGSA
ncbi:MAG: sugar phosphorylase [Verrucomicrobiia bacterium]